MKIRKFSEAGIWHKQRQEACQDAVLSGENERFSVIALADGVSSCSEARAGAQTACASFVELMLRNGHRFLDFSPEKTACFVVEQIRHALQERAAAEKKPAEAYSSTISGAVWDRNEGKALCFNLGDGLVLGAKDGRFPVLGMPGDSRNGCCVTTTRNAEKEAVSEIIDIDAGDHHGIFLFSDGAWKMMYRKNTLVSCVRAFLSNGDYDGLEQYFNGQGSFDDYSFVSMEF